jgi:hypothetical protein
LGLTRRSAYKNSDSEIRSHSVSKSKNPSKSRIKTIRVKRMKAY